MNKQFQIKTGTLIAIMFFVSGFSGLVFEVVWLRLLGLAFGSSHLATSVTVAVFMGGLALGGILSKRLSSFFPTGVHAYCTFEGLIGAYGLILPFIIHTFPKILTVIGLSSRSGAIELTLARFLLSAIFLLPPTTLMGATLPVLTATLSKDTKIAGKILSLLYALNTFGAVAGTFLSGFVFLPSFGVLITNILAAFGDLSVALAGYFILRQKSFSMDTIENEFSKDKTVEQNEGEPQQTGISLPYRLFLLITFICGFTSLGYQIVWTRSLSLVIGSSVYSFTIILVTFLLGIAIGGYLLWKNISTIRNKAALLALLLLIIGAGALISSFVIDRLPLFVLAFSKAPEITPFMWFVAQFFITSIVVLIPTTALGAAFPLVISLAAQRTKTHGKQELTEALGKATAANTVGAILGSLLTGTLIIPLLNADGAARIFFIANFTIAALLFLLCFKTEKILFSMIGITVSALLIISAIIAPRWNYARWSSGMFRFAVARANYFTRDYIEPILSFHKDGLISTVTVETTPWGALALRVNGKTDASSSGDMPTQILSGLIPALLHKDPEEAAVIGYGSGVTIGAVLTVPIKRVVAVELEPAVLTAARLFADYNHRPWLDKRLEEVADDGRSYLELTNERFDLIISEPSNPWVSGASNLFTLDFWKMSKARLKEGGIFAQWLQLYELSPENIKILFNTFQSVFKYVMIFASHPHSSDTLVIASDSPLFFDWNRISDTIAKNPGLRDELARAEIVELTQIPSLFIASEQKLKELTEGAPFVTDDNALIEFSAPLDIVRFADEAASFPQFRPSDGTFFDRINQFQNNMPFEDPEFLLKLCLSLLYSDYPIDARTACNRAMGELEPDKIEVAEELIETAKISDDGLLIPEWFYKDTGDRQFTNFRRFYENKDYKKMLVTIEEDYFKGSDWLYEVSRTVLYLLLGAGYTAADVMEYALPFPEEWQNMWGYYYLGYAYQQKGRYLDGVEEYLKYIRLRRKLEKEGLYLGEETHP